MSAQEMPVAGVTLDRLDDYLSSDRSPSESMMLSDLDGFLTGLAVGPSLVMPSEWLPIVWGGEQPEFSDEKEMSAVMGGIFSRYNEILRTIDRGDLEPIFWTADDDIVIAADWAEGFLDAIKLRWDDWKPLFQDDKQAANLFPILALCGDEDGASMLGLDAEAEDELMEKATTLIPSCVMEIAAFWKERRSPQTSNLRTDRTKAAASVAPKVGRNDPCPCGSGRKYKKCCGR